MTENDKLLTELYRDLFLNSPKTTYAEIPSGIGTGSISQTATKQGVILSDWKMNYHSDVNVHGLSSGDYIQIIFCMDHGVAWERGDGGCLVKLQKDESCIYRGNGGAEYILYEKGMNFSFKSLKFPVGYFQKILNDYFEISEVRTYEKKLLSEVSKVRMTPTMQRILAETKDLTCYNGGLGYLYLDSKIFEMLAVYLSEVLETDILRSCDGRLSRTERKAVMEAKHIIDSSIACAPSCEELSRQVHLSTAKLARGFKNAVGMPIHSYIIEQRLTKAAQLLLENQYNVGEIAEMIGYAKPSNFAAAFKKKYGVVPKAYRNTKLMRSEI